MHSNRRNSAFIKLRDPHLDCPNAECDGWLQLFGTPAHPKPRPAYLKCSNACNQPTIFSKRESECAVCLKTIRVRDIITTGWDHLHWVHIRCAPESVPPPNVFAVCLRCTENITAFEDSVPSRVGTVQGFIHRNCVKRHNHPSEPHIGSPESQSTYSQESQASV